MTMAAADDGVATARRGRFPDHRLARFAAWPWLHRRPEGGAGSGRPSPLHAAEPEGKYGFVLSLADVDGREATIGYAGVEGLFQLGASTFVSGQAVLGYARPGDIDFIGLSGGLVAGAERHARRSSQRWTSPSSTRSSCARPPTPAAWASAISQRIRPGRSPLALATDGLTGMAAVDDTRLELGLTWRFGAAGGATATGRRAAVPVVAALRPAASAQAVLIARLCSATQGACASRSVHERIPRVTP